MKHTLALLVLVGLPLSATAQDPSRWEKTIAAFVKEDAVKQPPHGGVVFTGSSSIALWKDLNKYFPKQHVLNRGFGGSTLPDVNHFLDRLVLQHEPRTVVLFCGGNDLAALKRSPAQVRDDFRTFVATIHAKLPRTKIVYLSIHLPPARVALAEPTHKTNAMIAEECGNNKLLRFVDIAPLMLGSDGQPDPQLYRDPLHPNARAYELWAAKIRPLLE